MGDEDHGAGVIQQKRFEPLDRFDVEVVGRLVQQQHVGLADQCARQQYPALPPARQGVDDRLRRQSQLGDDQLDALLKAPAVALFQFVLVVAESRHCLVAVVGRHFHRGMVVVRDQLAKVAEALRDHVEDGQVG